MPNPHFSDGKILTDPRKNWINQPTNVANVYLFWSSRSFSDSAHSAPLIFSLTILFFFFFHSSGFFYSLLFVFFFGQFPWRIARGLCKVLRGLISFWSSQGFRDSQWMISENTCSRPPRIPEDSVEVIQIGIEGFSSFLRSLKAGDSFSVSPIIWCNCWHETDFNIQKKKIVHLTVNLNQQNGRYFFLDISRC